MRIKKYEGFLTFGLTLVIALAILFTFGVPVAHAYTISGDSVSINDSKAYINAYPHTLGSSGYVNLEIQTKAYTGNVNLIFGFNTSSVTPRSIDLYNPHMVTDQQSYTCSGTGIWFNATASHFWCWLNVSANGTNTTQLIFDHDYTTANVSSKTAYWTTQHNEDWTSISDMFSSIDYSFDGKNKWYYALNVPITAGTLYKTRMYLNVPFNSNGKYDFAIYPSSYGTNIASALNDGNFYYLDPWFNTTYIEKVNVTISTTGITFGVNITIPIILNSSVLNFSNVKSDCSDIIAVNSTDTGTLNFWLETCRSDANNNTVMWVNWKNTTLNPYIWIYYNNSAATSQGNATALFGFYHGFDDGVQPYGMCNVNSPWAILNIQSAKYVSSPSSLNFYGAYSARACIMSGFGAIDFTKPYVYHLETNMISGAVTNAAFTIDHAFATGASTTRVYQTSSGLYNATFGKKANLTTNVWYSLTQFNNITATINTTQMWMNNTFIYSSFQTSENLGGDILSHRQEVDTGNVNVTIDDEFVVNSSSTMPSYAFGAPIKASSLAPSVSIQSPTNTTYGTQNISVNYTVTKQLNNIDKCWYVLNAGSNVFLTSCANITYLFPKGTNTLVIYVNDTSGLSASSSISFTVDNATPTISIQNPQNRTYASTNQTLNFTASDAYLDTCIRELNGVNTTITPKCSNQTFLGVDLSTNTLKIFVNDTVNNTAVASVSFTIDSVEPQVDIISPANTTYNTLNTSLIFTVTHTGTVDMCWYILNGGANITLPSCNNITFTATSGANNITVYANDSAGNIGLHSHGFSTDTNPPTVTIQSPSNSTYYGNTSIYLSYTASDTNGATCSYSINGSVYVGLSGCNNATINGFSDGIFKLDLNATDGLGNSGITEVNFTIIHGVNLSTYLPNGTVLTSWNVNASNSTYSVNFSSLSNPTLISFSQLPQGTVTFNATQTSGKDSDTWTQAVSSTMGIVPHNFTLYPYTNVSFYDTVAFAPITNWALTVTANGSQYINVNVSSVYVVSGRNLLNGSNSFVGSKLGYIAGTAGQTIDQSTGYDITINAYQTTAAIWAVDEITRQKLAFNAQFILVSNNATAVQVTAYRNTNATAGGNCLWDNDYYTSCEGITSQINPTDTNLSVSYGQDYNNATYRIRTSQTIQTAVDANEDSYFVVWADGHLIYQSPTYHKQHSDPNLTSYYEVNLTVVNDNFSYNKTINFTIQLHTSHGGATYGYFDIEEFKQVNNTAGYIYLDNLTLSIPQNLLSGYNQFVVNFVGDPTVQEGYTNQRSYYLTLGNSSNFSVVGYLLKDVGYNGFFQYWTVLNANNLPIPDTKITIGRWYNGVESTVGQCVSNLAGSCRIWIQSGQLLYSLRAEHSGYETNYTALNEWTGVPNPAYIYLKSTGTANFTSIYAGISVTLLPTATYLRNITNATCQVFAGLGNLNTLNMTVFRYANGTTSLFGSYYTNSNPTGTTVNILMNATGQYMITCSYSWTSNATGTSIIYSNKQSRTVWLYSDNMEGIGTGQFGDFGIFLLLGILLFVCIALALYSPTYAGLVGICILLMGGWVGMVPDIMIGGTMVSAWMIISLVVLTLIAFVFLKSNV